MGAGNFRGDGSSPDAAAERELRAQYRAQAAERRALRGQYHAALQKPHRGERANPCPECSVQRRTAETLRVHRWIAHGIQVAS